MITIKKKLILFILVLLILPFVYAAAYGSGNYSEGVYEGLYCGDGTCNNGETCSTCSADCGSCEEESSSGGGGGSLIIKKPECSSSSDCNYSQYCLDNKCYDAECFDDSVCNTKEGETCFDYRCVKLFDIEILDFESPVKLGEFFEFTYFIKSIANISGDIEINFWIEKDENIVTSGKDTIYFGNFEEKTKTQRLFLPMEIDSGTYFLRMEVTYERYTVKSHRTIELIVSDKLATIGLLPSTKRFVNYIISVLIGIGVFILFFVFYLERRKIKRQIETEEKWIKRHKLTSLTFVLIIILGSLTYYFKWHESIRILIIKIYLFFVQYSALLIGLTVLIILTIIARRVYRRKYKKIKKQRTKAIKETYKKRVKKGEDLKRKGGKKKLLRQLASWKRRGYNTSVLVSRSKSPSVKNIKNKVRAWKTKGYDTGVLKRKK